MITIKKADGTFAKVPLSEFKKMSASRPAAQPSGAAAPASSAGRHRPAKSISRADARSPLEEKLPSPATGKVTHLFSPKREEQVKEVLGKLDFSVAGDVLGRLKSLVLARLKDIKSEDETRELLARSINNGGLGLTDDQADKVIQSCREAEGTPSAADEHVPALKGKAVSRALMVEPQELPAVANEVKPMPYNKIGESVVEKFARTPAPETVFKLDTQPAVRRPMHDVVASDVEMGPVEEIKSVSLTDFRRLSGNPEEAAKRLQQKMFNLQEESFVWYLDALAAYHASPLYTEYMQAVCQSLAERKSLANILAMKNSVNLNEAIALIEMEKSL